MMKRIIFFFMLVISSISFSTLNDHSQLLNDGDKKVIEEKIQDIEKESNISLYVNLGRKMDEKNIVNKTIILDIIPDGKDDVNVKLKFTPDFDTSKYEAEIESTLDQGEALIKEKKYKDFIISVLDVSSNVMDEIKEDNQNLSKQEVKKSFIENKFSGILILVFIFIGSFSGNYFPDRHRKRINNSTVISYNCEVTF
jgi:hypothetical protein